MHNCGECRYYCIQGACGRGLDFNEYRDSKEPCSLKEVGERATFKGELKSIWDWEANHRIEQAPKWVRELNEKLVLVHYSCNRSKFSSWRGRRTQIELVIVYENKDEIRVSYADKELLLAKALKRFGFEIGTQCISARYETDYVTLKIEGMVRRQKEHQSKLNHRASRSYQRRKSQSPSQKVLTEQS